MDNLNRPHVIRRVWNSCWRGSVGGGANISLIIQHIYVGENALPKMDEFLGAHYTVATHSMLHAGFVLT
jgi:hypothetical protein